MRIQFNAALRPFFLSLACVPADDGLALGKRWSTCSTVLGVAIGVNVEGVLQSEAQPANEICSVISSVQFSSWVFGLDFFGHYFISSIIMFKVQFITVMGWQSSRLRGVSNQVGCAREIALSHF